ncbi:hypothetical protein [Kribbella sp. NPDC051718]|uniref:DUF3472 domain-containing protein n=1 Tax=Kribbella sp. NPDC051718 TaxID=3155168 RepID=UPI00342844D9
MIVSSAPRSSPHTFDAASLTQAEFRMTIQQAPGRANVYWSNQFQFTSGDVGGYTGMQTHRDGGGMFLYSLWNSTDWKAGSAGTYCIKFSEDGSGGSCRLDQAPTPGHTYGFTVASEGSGWYGVTVRDLTAGTSFKLGSLQTGAATRSVRRAWSAGPSTSTGTTTVRPVPTSPTPSSPWRYRRRLPRRHTSPATRRAMDALLTAR